MIKIPHVGLLVKKIFGSKMWIFVVRYGKLWYDIDNITTEVVDRYDTR